jgi:hypothetical protein
VEIAGGAVEGAVDVGCYTFFIAQGYHNLGHAKNVFNCYPEVAETWRTLEKR